MRAAPTRRLAVALLAAALAVALLPGIAAADHPAVGTGAFLPVPTAGVNAGGEGAEWELLGSFLTGNPHSDLDFFTQDGITYASVGVLGTGPDGGGQTIIRLTDADGAVAPAFVASHPSAQCVTDPVSVTGLQHDVEATPKGDVPLNTTWGDLADRRDAQLLIDATDATGRCHDGGATGQGLLDAPHGGLELIDITDVANPVEIALTSHIGEAHTVNVDPSRPHIVYAVTSDSVSVRADEADCDDDGDTEELIRANECSGSSLDGFEVLDISSCLDFPEDATVEDKRGIAEDGSLEEGAGCRPEVYRFRYPSLDLALGHTNLGSIYGCHELEVFPDDTLACASGAAMITFDISGMFDDAGTPGDRSDDRINGTPLPCRVRPSSSSTPDRATGAPVIDCVQGGTDAEPLDLTVSGWIELGAPSAQGIRHLGTAYHMGRESLTGAAEPAFDSTQDIDFNHEAEYTHSGRFVLTTDERGGGILPPGASCASGIDNVIGNGGIHAYATDRLLADRPVPATTAEESAFDPELAFSSYARTPDGEKAVYRAQVRTGVQPTICTAHVFQQIEGQNRIFMGWYSQGTQVVDYIEHPDGSLEFREVAWMVPEEANQWVSAIFRVEENEDGTSTYYGATGDFRLTESGRSAIDVYAVTLPRPAQLADEVVAVDQVGGGSPAETAIAVSQDVFAGGADAVVLGRADEYADNLAGGPLAARERAPLLYTASDSLDPATAEEIRRLGATRAFVLGGEQAVSGAVEASLESLGLSVTRFDGANRYDTARLIAEELGSATGTAHIVEGGHADPARGWPDPLSTAALAGFQGDPILLVDHDRLPDETAAALGDLDVDRAVLTGGEAAVSAAVEAAVGHLVGATDRLAGETRYETSLAVRDAQVAAGMDPSTLTVATGLDWADALAAGPASAIRGTTFAIIDGQGGPDTLDQLLAAEGLRVVRIVGGADAVVQAVRDRIADAVAPASSEEEPQAAGIPAASTGDTALALVLVGLAALVAWRRRGAGVDGGRAG